MIPFPFQAGQFGIGGADYDPYWSGVVALLHMDGADASTTFTDQTGKTWTANGNAQIDTEQSKFGGASGLFDGTGDYVTTPHHADFDFGSGEFTIEMFARLGTVTGGHHLIGKYTTSTQGPFAIYQNAAEIGFYSSSNGTSWNLLSDLTFGSGFTTGVWYHLSVTRNGDVWRTFKDGSLVSSSTVAGTVVSNTQPVQLGRGSNGSPTEYNGHIDEVRITKGIARYTANFTPPTAPFPNS